MSPITSPMRAPSSRIVSTVRCTSDTALPATSVDFAACSESSLIEAASSSTEFAAEPTCDEKSERHNAGARMHLRSLELLGRRFHRLASMRDDVVGARQHVLRIEVDHLPQRIDLIEACDPLREDVAVVLHLLGDRSFALRFAVDVVEQGGELILRRKEQLMRQLGLRQPVFGLLTRHGQSDSISRCASNSVSHSRFH